jgi:hypothetical protein
MGAEISSLGTEMPIWIWCLFDRIDICRVEVDARTALWVWASTHPSFCNGAEICPIVFPPFPLCSNPPPYLTISKEGENLRRFSPSWRATGLTNHSVLSAAQTQAPPKKACSFIIYGFSDVRNPTLQIVLGMYQFPNTPLQDLAIGVPHPVISTIIALGAPIRWPLCNSLP